jgi:hypothetical protein
MDRQYLNDNAVEYWHTAFSWPGQITLARATQLLRLPISGVAGNDGMSRVVSD